MSGVIVRIEIYLGHTVLWLICLCHLNELPLRKVFLLYDGKTVGPDSFEGKLGKEARAQHFLKKPVINFKTIKSSLTVVREDLSDKNLSKDQSLMLDYALAIITGKLEKKTANRMIGAIVHSRWCNLATSLMAMYTREKKPSSNLKTLVKYIVQVRFIILLFQIVLKKKEVCKIDNIFIRFMYLFGLL